VGGAVKLPRIPKLFVGPYVPLDRPRFPVDRELVSKQLRVAGAMPPNSIKRVILEEDTFVAQPFLDELPIG
jgi:hypothetical protein